MFKMLVSIEIFRNLWDLCCEIIDSQGHGIENFEVIQKAITAVKVCNCSNITDFKI